MTISITLGVGHPQQKYTDEEIRSWAFMTERGGSFIRAFGTAILHADMANFAMLRNVAEQMIDKYPNYLITVRK